MFLIHWTPGSSCSLNFRYTRTYDCGLAEPLLSRGNIISLLRFLLARHADLKESCVAVEVGLDGGMGEGLGLREALCPLRFLERRHGERVEGD